MARRRVELDNEGIKNIADRFMALHEYTYITKPMISEEDEDVGEVSDENIENSEENSQDNNENPIASIEEPSNIEQQDNVEGEDSEEVVINIDDLVQSQKSTEEQVLNISDRLSELSSIVKDFNDAIESLSVSTEELKNEFEKRLPTDIETLTIRSLSSYPFDKNIDKYWDEKQKNSHYRVNTEDNSKEKEEYVIRKRDILNHRLY